MYRIVVAFDAHHDPDYIKSQFLKNIRLFSRSFRIKRIRMEEGIFFQLMTDDINDIYNAGMIGYSIEDTANAG